MLAAAADDPDRAVDRVRAQLTGRAADACAEWFATLPDVRARCTALSLAVLNRLPREAIGLAADRLEELLVPDQEGTDRRPAPDPFGAAGATLLATLGARAVPGVVPTVHGDLPATLLCYTEPGFGGRVLRHVWEEYDTVRQTLVDWLRELGGNSSPHVRVRAATAVGALACDSFDFVTRAIIMGWARSDDPRLRDSAALALSLPGTDGELRATVRALVGDWTEREPEYQATAARVYGASLGLEQPTHALVELTRLSRAEEYEVDVVIALAQSLVELVAHGTPAFAGRVLGEVLRWGEGSRPEQRTVGRLAFVGLTTSLAKDSRHGTDLADRAVWPTLLVLADRDPDRRAQVARLWARGLGSADLHGPTATALDEWAETVEASNAARAALARLLAGVAVDSRTREIVRRRALAWTGRDGTAPRTGQAVLSILSGGVPL
jgi:hypothetical protein